MFHLQVVILVISGALVDGRRFALLVCTDLYCTALLTRICDNQWNRAVGLINFSPSLISWRMLTLQCQLRTYAAVSFNAAGNSGQNQVIGVVVVPMLSWGVT
jgi:hypothetical protein